MNPPDIEEARRQIVEVIGDCAYHALALAESLADEKRALEEQDMDALDIAISNKSQCVTELRNFEDQRKTLCSASGIPAGPEQMQRMIDWCDESSIVTNCWQHLMDVVTHCDSLNMTNGAIIRGRKQHVDTSISILRSGQPASTIYNRDGHKPQLHSLRSIAEA